jgi:UPF0271 protein
MVRAMAGTKAAKARTAKTKAVLDTSALIYLNDFRPFDCVFTVSEVLREVKDRTTAMKLSTLSSLGLKVFEPSKGSMEAVERAAKETGDFAQLSETDKKVLALANDLSDDCVIVSDDMGVQNVAERMGIRYMSVFNRRISRMVKWGRYCGNCKKYYGKEYKMRACEVCGGELKRVPLNSELVKTKSELKQSLSKN